MKIAQLLKTAQNRLTENNIPNARLDSVLLLAYASGLSQAKILSEPDMILTQDVQDKFTELIEKRAAHVPFQYLVNKAEFMSLDFYVDENVLIPREDTEVLVEKVIESVKIHKLDSMLELCTGSGCISVSVAKYCPGIKITAVDICNKALKIAEKNAYINNVSSQIDFIHGDVLNEDFGDYALIVANPPYIRSEVIPGLDKSVKDYEPLLALDGGKDGLVFYKRIAEIYKGHVVVEIGYDQGREVADIFKNNNFTNIEIYKDLSHLDRVVYAYK